MPPNPDSYVSPRPFIESGKATIPELYEWHAQENPSYHIFRYRNGQSTEGITYAQMNKGIIRAARQVVSFVGPATHSQHVIAILANAGSSLTFTAPSFRFSEHSVYFLHNSIPLSRLDHICNHSVGSPACRAHSVPNLVSQFSGCRGRSSQQDGMQSRLRVSGPPHT